ncbi:MAG: efflux RND transporter periplasmic adaptor subunit [Xanthobacteraceae bacterium]|nr:MAG: efflux RND transporter periplasmic adaptor subunit [Xanthobacteraceae bacterium]
MKASRYTAVGLVAAATLWILSGHLIPHVGDESNAASRPSEAPTEKPFRVSVERAELKPHARRLSLSGRTEADRKVMITARTNGLVTRLNVKRGQTVQKDDIVAVLSDEAREAQVAQATALFNQRKAEFEARRKLIEQGTLPRLDLVNIESQFKAASAALAAAEAERDRGVIAAPWAGIITDVPTQVGQPMSSGKEIAQLVALDPMLAIVEVSERKLAGLSVGTPAEIRLVSGQTATGRVRHVAKTASPATRTYRIEVEIANADGAIPDGITAEVTIPLAAVAAVQVPRSSLTFSSAGELGVRIVGNDSRVEFVKVALIADAQDMMWIDGIANGARVIVQGQDFVREGQRVEPVPAPATTAQR